MNSLEFSIVYAMIRPEIDERVSVGIIFCQDDKIEVKYSNAKLDAVKNLVPASSFIYLKRALKTMATKNALDSVSRIDYLSRYSNNILTVSNIKKVRIDTPNLSKKKLYKMYVYNRAS